MFYVVRKEMSSTRVEDKLIEYEYRCTEYRFAEYEYEDNNCLTRSQRRGSRPD